MADKAKRGTKRTCGGCGAKFYDLNRDPVICPMCETVFEVKKVEPKPKKEPVKVEPPKPEVKTEDGEELLEGEDELIDIDDDDDEKNIQSTEDDDSFLEVEDESENAVNSIMPTSSGTKDEDS